MVSTNSKGNTVVKRRCTGSRIVCMSLIWVPTRCINNYSKPTRCVDSAVLE